MGIRRYAKIGKIFDRICTNKNYDIAIKRLKKNSGSKTAGTDGKTIEYVLNNYDYVYEVIKRKLENKYIPKRVRRVYIEEQNKRRPLGIPCIVDRVIQQMFKQIIEPIVEPKFHPNSFGFRPERSTENALALQSNLINRGKMYYCADIDIKGFFDNINHKKLIKQIWSIGIRDKKVISIIKSMLRAEIELPNGKIEKPTKGTPQGGILSPLLANICLNELDWWINSQYVDRFPNRQWASQNGKEKFLRLHTKIEPVKIVRYADDFKLMCSTLKGAKYYFKIVKLFLNNRLKLDISEKKSRVVNLRRSSSEFLGFRIRAKKKKCAQTEYIAWVNVSEKSKKKIKTNLKKSLDDLRWSKDPFKVAGLYNSKIRGIQNYYSMATTVSKDFSDIGWIIDRIKYNIFGKAKTLKMKDI